MPRPILAALALLAACDLPELRRQDFELVPDAAVPARADAARDTPPPPDVLTPAPDTLPAPPDVAPTCTPTCGADQLCDQGTGTCVPRNGTGVFSGVVVSACDPNRHLAALVGIGGQHTCSFTGKGSFFFDGLPIGVRLTVTSKKEGFARHTEVVTIPPEGLAGHQIALMPESGCAAPEPGADACVCHEPVCR